MKFIKQYIQYLRNNPERYWFKRKVYGWGWVPATWQGWLSLAVMIVIFVWFLTQYESYPVFSIANIVWLIVGAAIWIGALFLLCYFTGEPPKWQWGDLKNSSDK